jgi:hypothetical protein
MIIHPRRLLAATVTGLAALALCTAAASADPVQAPAHTATAERQYDGIWDADQGIAVDRDHFYAIDNSEITRYDRDSGRPELQFVGAEDGPIKHLDSGMVRNGKLYAAHSNYPEWPMESSIEVFDTRTMKHVDTYSFGIAHGSLTWLDRHHGSWWAAFANYDKVQDGMDQPYGGTYNTKVFQLDDDFQPVQSWTIPHGILDRFEEMSNSGGSWGPDGNLYLTGHDLPETYVMALPESGTELTWVDTVALDGIEGQGIAWDRSDRRHPTLFGISRDNDRVVEFELPLSDLAEVSEPGWRVVGPGDFVR